MVEVVDGRKKSRDCPVFFVFGGEGLVLGSLEGIFGMRELI